MSILFCANLVLSLLIYCNQNNVQKNNLVTTGSANAPVISTSGKPIVRLLNTVALPQKIIRASFEVYKFLGNGFKEVIYQGALAWDLSGAGHFYAKETFRIFFLKNFQTH